MENFEIAERVEYEINNWKKIKIEDGLKVNISENATSFIVELISNIKNDPSTYWKLNNDYESFQNLAIARIPDALDYCTYQGAIRIPYRMWRSRKIFKIISETKEANISTWEIWSSLSHILIDFCFIPEKDM